MPVTIFTYRHWEALRFRSNDPNKVHLYPNIRSSMDAVGDLCHHTKHAIHRKEIWITDKLGFRNDEYIDRADVLIIGDSFIGGCCISQDDIISNRLKREFNDSVLVYNMAPSSFTEFDRFRKLGIIKTPKLIIFSVVERHVPEAICPYKITRVSRLKDMIKDVFGFCGINILIDKALRQYSMRWVQSRIIQSKGEGKPARDNPNMFFMMGSSQKYEVNDMQTTAKNIISYKYYCDSLGVRFLFLPMPNKETVYYELIPFEKQPDYLIQLDSILCSYSVLTINTLKIYNEYRKSNDRWLYNLDDTHWSPDAIKLIAGEIAEKIRKDKRLGLNIQASTVRY